MIHAVIGAQYGDEGKGLITDYLSDESTLVVRFNGGAQAGHTVVCPDRARHEFHHFSAGSFRGASTLLSRFFIVNPLIFCQEHRELAALGVCVHVFADERAIITTPFDMMLNAAVEDKRGESRHGSCGVGINETVERSEYPEFRLTVQDLGNPSINVLARLERIQREWVPRRASELHVPIPDMSIIEAVIARWIQDAEFFFDRVSIISDDVAVKHWSNVVFEGAQGLRLDEKAAGFPHVTRSRTGLPNVLAILEDAGVSDLLTATYVTRAYTTRHGNGPLAHECFRHPYGWVGPETNTANRYQGELRYARLDLSELSEAIWGSISCLDPSRHPPVDLRLAVTCLDQTPFEPYDFTVKAAQFVGITPALYSVGPTRLDVRSFNEVLA
jgi:adenylosuccinate synthase